MQQENKLGQMEALLFAAGEPLSVPQLAELLGINKPQTWELLGLLPCVLITVGLWICCFSASSGTSSSK